jgi:hypothetical protein
MRSNFRKFIVIMSFDKQTILKARVSFEKRMPLFLGIILSIISVCGFLYYYANGLGLAYNDARSHLDISRRVIENLKPGFAQLGSVWLPLPHVLMLFTIWNDFMWHSGLAGALPSMIAYVSTGLIIYQFLRKIDVGMIGRLVGVFVFALNINVLYMQTTAMTELLLIVTMLAGIYELVKWHKEERLFYLVTSAFWIMLSTLIRYDGWFLFIFAAGLVSWHVIKKYGYRTAEGAFVFFCTLGGFGIALWFFWNQIIFHDPLYFIFGPFSANAQQEQLEAAGVLATKKNFFFSLETYWYAMVYNASLFTVLLSCYGALLFWFDKRIAPAIRIASTMLLTPLFFNVLALFFGHSVLFVQGLSGNSWFNVRYGLMMVPSLAIFSGYTVSRAHSLRFVIIGLLVFISFFSFMNKDAVTIDDARLGASGKNVSEVSGWLRDHATQKDGYVLISVASHDAIIFSSGLPMKRFIHEGTGDYWKLATSSPEQYARWLIMRTNDTNDMTFRILQGHPSWEKKYQLINHFPFADIYELKPEYVSLLKPLPKIANNK